jgi:hypothetical protein
MEWQNRPGLENWPLDVPELPPERSPDMASK